MRIAASLAGPCNRLPRGPPSPGSSEGRPTGRTGKDDFTLTVDLRAGASSAAEGSRKGRGSKHARRRRRKDADDHTLTVSSAVDTGAAADVSASSAGAAASSAISDAESDDRASGRRLRTNPDEVPAAALDDDDSEADS